MRDYEPLELKNFYSANPRLKKYIIYWMNHILSDISRSFVQMRYMDRKTMEEISENLHYSERSLYKMRRRIIESWRNYTNHDILEDHQKRLWNMIKRHGEIEHSRLLKNFNLKRQGLNIFDFEYMIDKLILEEKIICQLNYKKNRKKPIKIYTMTNYTVNNSSIIRHINYGS